MLIQTTVLHFRLFRLMLVTLLLNLLGCAEQAASGKDVLSAACPYGCEDAMIGKIVAEALDVFVVCSLQVNVRNRVESDKIESAVQSLYEFYYLASMCSGVVQSFEHDVFEGKSALVREVVVAEQFHNLLY